MAKDTEKLIRQLSLISYLMAERRPVTALEIRRDVEGYSGMNEDAFARRFYADRAELESLGIQLTVERARRRRRRAGELLAAAGELPPARRSRSPTRSWPRCRPRCRCSTASSPTPSRCGSRCSRSPGAGPSPLNAPEQGSIALGITGSAGGHELSQRLAKIETAIFRHKTITFDYYTMERDETGPAQGRPVPPAVPGRPVLPPRPRARARRAARLPPVAHPRQGRLRHEGRARLQAARRTSTRAPTPAAPTGSSATRTGTAEIWISDRIALAGRAPLRPLRRGPPGRGRRRSSSPRATRTPASSSPGCCGLGEHARVLVAARAAGRGRRARRACSPTATTASSTLAEPVARGAEPAARRAGPRERRRPPRRRDPPRALRAPGDARERSSSRPAAAGSASRSRRSASACSSPSRSCARTSTCSTS